MACPSRGVQNLTGTPCPVATNRDLKWNCTPGVLYASAVLLLCLTPGPNSLLAVTNGLRFGVGKTLFSTLGCAAGLTLLIGASLSGLGLILAASETVFYIIKWLGACYLIYLGISLIRTRGAFADVRRESRTAAPPSEFYLFAQGLWIVVMNPKAVIFFGRLPATVLLPPAWPPAAVPGDGRHLRGDRGRCRESCSPYLPASSLPT